MKKYHFQENEPDFGLTVRLDEINDKVKELAADEADELGDANAFLDAFESESFAPPKRNPAEEEDTENEEYETDEETDGLTGLIEEFGLNKKTAGLLLVLGIFACIIGFSFVRCGFHAEKKAAVTASADTPLLIQADEGDGTYSAYDIAAKERKTVLLTEATKLTDENGRSVTKAALAVGDLFAAELDRDGKTLLHADFSAVETEKATGLTPDSKKRTLSSEEKSYSYDKETMVFYNDEKISIDDLASSDTLCLKLLANTVWVIDVEEYHGYILVENADTIKDGTIQIDEEEAIPIENGMRLAAAEGHHTVTVSGSNIETRTDALVVEAGEETVYDLSRAQDKMGVIIVKANIKDYKLYVNGAVAESPVVLPMGEYDLVILKSGYTEWSKRVTLQDDTLTVTAELQRDMQYGTLTVTADVEGAWVAVDGEEYGTAPLQLNLPYGTHRVTVQKSGYTTYKQTIEMQSETATLHATLAE